MAKRPRFFTTLPRRVMADARPTALDLRCLAMVAFHDGMSRVKGSGAGCFARYASMAAMVGTDVSNFSKSISRWIAWGYIVREPQPNDRRRFTLRVVYDDDDDSWRADQQSPGEKVGEPTNKRAKVVGEADSFPADIVGEGDAESGGNPPKTDPYYIQQSCRLNSVETARRENAPRRVGDDLSDFEGASERQENSAEAGLGKGAWEAADPPGVVGMLCRLEREFKRDPANIGSVADNVEWLAGIVERDADNNGPIFQQAQRVLELLEAYQRDQGEAAR